MRARDEARQEFDGARHHLSHPGAILRDMEITIERAWGNWKAVVDTKCIAVTRSLAELRDRLEEMTGDPQVGFRIDPAVDHALARHAAAQAASGEAAKALAEATRAAIRALKSAGIGNRDIGEMVGLSRSRVQQLASDSSDSIDSIEAPSQKVANALATSPLQEK